MKRLSLVVLLAAALAALAYGDPTITISTLPLSGTVGGGPGTVVGWGFTLTDSSADQWVILDDSSFSGPQVYGTYVDYLASNSYVAGPAPESSTLHVAWNPSLIPPQGLGEFDLNPTALPGASIRGNIVVDYQLFSEDPNSPSFDPGSFISAGTVDAPVDINVVPEPASIFLTGGAILLLAIAFAWRRTRQRA
jgi:hypothetical protein